VRADALGDPGVVRALFVLERGEDLGEGLAFGRCGWLRFCHAGKPALTFYLSQVKVEGQAET
jgi:hypothetical protein